MATDPQAALNDQIGKVLLGAAMLLQSEMMRRLSRSAGPVRVQRRRGRGSYTVYTTPSKPGEYLRTRTGFLRARIAYQPATPEEVGRVGYVQVGYEAGAWYGGYWETRADAQRRKGLADLLQEMAPTLAGELARVASLSRGL